MLLTLFSIFLVTPVFAVAHYGGQWYYGAGHEPNNWGAFSNFYHPSSSHWSHVGSTARRNQKTAYAGAGRYSYAFIHTNIGERVTFNAGK